MRTTRSRPLCLTSLAGCTSIWFASGWCEMGMSMSFDVAGFARQMKATEEQMHKSARPAAQAGAQVIYNRAKLNASTLRSDREHYFYGKTAAKAPKGQK